MGFLSKLSIVLGPKPLKAKKNKILCDLYSVKGKNPDTNRRKTEIVVAESTASETEIQQRSGLLPPYEIKRLDPELPTEKQILYARKLGIVFPPDASIRDASIFLTRADEEQPLIQPPTPDYLVRYLIDKGIFVHSYAGIMESSALYLSGVSFLEKSAFFCMRVFCDIKSKTYCLLEDAPQQERELFFKFANLHEDDNAFAKSVAFYSSTDLPLNRCPPLKKIKAYNIAADFLKSERAV